MPIHNTLVIPFSIVVVWSWPANLESRLPLGGTPSLFSILAETSWWENNWAGIQQHGLATWNPGYTIPMYVCTHQVEHSCIAWIAHCQQNAKLEASKRVRLLEKWFYTWRPLPRLWPVLAVTNRYHTIRVQTSFADPWHFCSDPDPRIRNLWLTDPTPDLDPAIFVSDLQDSNKKVFLFITFWSCIYIIF